MVGGVRALLGSVRFPVLIGLLVLARSAAAEPRSCVRRFEAAKRDLIAHGFHPTSDHDTAKWLVVDGDATEASMGLEMGGADGPHIGYWVTVAKANKVTKAADWHVRKRALCCDDNHEADDHIIQFTSEKTKRGFIAQIVLDRFGDHLKETQDEANLFIAAARKAAEDCMR
jgi:hypothetical protein